MIRYGGRQVVGFADAPCPGNPPPPTGYVVWQGPVPAELVQWSVSLLSNIRAVPYGQQWSTTFAGGSVVARKDYHTWTYRRGSDGSMTLVTGLCIPGITLYRPAPAVGSVSGVGQAPLAQQVAAAQAVDQQQQAQLQALQSAANQLVVRDVNARPDPSLAVFSVPSTEPPERTDWRLVAVTAVAAAAVTTAFWWGLHAAAAPVR